MNQFKKEEAESLWSGLVKGRLTPPVAVATCGGGGGGGRSGLHSPE